MKFRKKPIIIDAEQYKPGMEDGFNFYEITGKFICYRPKNAKTFPRAGRRPVIETLEGNHEITPTDWIVIGVKGERYPVKDDIFRMTYEPVESDELSADRKLMESVWYDKSVTPGVHHVDD